MSKNVKSQTELLLTEFVSELDNKIPEDNLVLVKNILAELLESYTITKQERLPVVYKDFPKEVKDYIAIRKVEGASNITLINYRDVLKRFFLLTGLNVHDVTANNIRIYLFKYQEEFKVSNRTLDHMKTVICTFFKWCAASGIIDTDPTVTVKPIKYERKQKDFLNDTELELMRNACRNKNEKAILEFLYSTGCRLSELVNAKLDDLDLANGEIRILGKGNKWRTVYLNAKAKITLQDYLKSRKDNQPYVFVTKRGQLNGKSKNYTGNAVEDMIREMGKRAGIKKKVHPHMIRHSFATLGLMHGLKLEEVQKMLGHEQISTTMIYTTIAQDQIKQAHHRAIA